MSSKLISIRVPKELHEKMKRYRHINWSEVARQAFEEAIEREEQRQRIRESLEVIDEIWSRLRREYGDIEYDSAQAIREWRDRRFAYT